MFYVDDQRCISNIFSGSREPNGLNFNQGQLHNYKVPVGAPRGLVYKDGD